MVVLTDEDLTDLPLATAHRIEVLHFRPAGQLDPILANKSYYLEPEPAGVRAYVLFRDALERSGRVAVAKVAIRQREALAALRVRDGVLVLETLLWPDEVRAPDFKFLDEDVEVRSQELKMAASLIDTMTEDFDPTLYKDAYREALEALVQAKIEGNERGPPGRRAEPPERQGRPADLTEIAPRERGRGQGDRAKPAETAAKPAKRPRPRQPGRASSKKAAGGAARTSQPDEQARRAPSRTAEGDPRDRAPSRTGPAQLVSLGDRPGLRRGDAPARSRPSSGQEPVLCVHGMSGSSTQLDRPDGPAPPPSFACAAVDLPGFGYSPPPRRTAATRSRALAQTVIRLIEAPRPRPGAPDRQLDGRRGRGPGRGRPPGPGPDAHPDLPGPARPAAPAGPGPLPADDALPGVGAWLVRRYQALPPENRVADVIATCYNDPGALHPDRFAAEVAELARRDALGYAHRRAAAARSGPWSPSSSGRLAPGGTAARITAPTLVIYGSHDRLVDPRIGAAGPRARSATPGWWCCRTPATSRRWSIPVRWPPRSACSVAGGGRGNSRSRRPVDRGTGPGSHKPGPLR